jgi:PEP-CTERM motif
MKSILACLAVALFSCTAEAGFSLTLVAAPGVNLNNLTVGQVVTIDLIASSTTSGEVTTDFDATQLDVGGVNIIGSLTSGPGFNSPLTSSPIVGILQETVVAAGTGSFYLDFADNFTSSGGYNGHFSTNDNTYFVDTNGLTYTAISVPEPSSLALCGIAGVVGLTVARMRRKRARSNAGH